MDSPIATEISSETANRRTFAIISHPDAGKTTLTEKFLLYGKAIHLAGSVRARRNQRSARSDWMEIERERGISITSPVLQFPYRGRVVNLLDTPGHADFSEDTYRTLSAVDSAVMVLDAAKGVEPQTRKLFEVCRERGIPVFTFVNKLDRPALDRLALLDEIETVLGMQPVPMNWPIGDGPSFCGVYDRQTQAVHLYDRTTRNESEAPELVTTLSDPRIPATLGDHELAEFHTSLELLDGLGIAFDWELVQAGKQTPVYFGSALTNFGVQLFLDGFVAHAPAPGQYPANVGWVGPDKSEFSGFVFKIQANMNPKHRDSVAFLRICSGKFERNMEVLHNQSGQLLRLPRPYKFFADEREVIDDAYPGDIIGLPNKEFAIGDTLSQDKNLQFAPIPRFEPEFFAMLRNTDISRQKNFQKGLQQLEAEGAMQVLYRLDSVQRDPILAVVGMLQFDVVQARLDGEYNVPTTIEPLSYKVSRWLEGEESEIEKLPWGRGMVQTRDREQRLVALFRSQYDLEYCQEKFPKLKYLRTH
ncbi:MAG TPA: peptide chain release factor 3 [Anaerolineales bacterium]|nr:peptide chain release factor 3 [Anaerolineales bacterium]